MNYYCENHNSFPTDIWSVLSEHLSTLARLRSFVLEHAIRKVMTPFGGGKVVWHILIYPPSPSYLSAVERRSRDELAASDMSEDFRRFADLMSSSLTRVDRKRPNFPLRREAGRPTSSFIPERRKSWSDLPLLAVQALRLVISFLKHKTREINLAKERERSTEALTQKQKHRGSFFLLFSCLTTPQGVPCRSLLLILVQTPDGVKQTAACYILSRGKWLQASLSAEMRRFTWPRPSKNTGKNGVNECVWRAVIKGHWWVNLKAKNENNKSSEAIDILNEIRKRARGTLPANLVLKNLTSQGKDLDRQAIWKERRIELAMEQHRWFDLIRQKRAADVMKKAGKNFIDNKYELLPIPQTEIDISNGMLTQNKGYWF